MSAALPYGRHGSTRVSVEPAGRLCSQIWVEPSPNQVPISSAWMGVSNSRIARVMLAARVGHTWFVGTTEGRWLMAAFVKARERSRDQPDRRRRVGARA